MKTPRLLIGMLLLTVGCAKNSYTLPDDTAVFDQSVKYNNKVDIVLMVDNSSSMDTYQNKLAAQAPGMLSALNQFGMDYQIVVVTTDMRPGGNGGIFVGSPKILNRQSTSVENALTNRIKQGTGGSDLERGLSSIETALSKETGFLRSDALLAIMILSNEDDHSTESAEHYIQFLDALKPKFNGVSQAWLLNFIGVPNLQSSCSTALDGIYKEPGLQFIKMAEYSSGLVQAICDTTLADAVTNIKKRIVEVLSEFALGRKPVVESIKVKVNGNEIPQSNDNGWEYIPDGYRIKLHGSAVPGSASDKISIDFTPAEAT